MALRTRNAAILFKAESVEGSFEAPSAASDGVLVEAPDVQLNPQNVDTNEVTGSLDGRGPIVGGLQAKISFPVYLKGTGMPGVAPEFGDMLRACGWAETITRTDIVAGTIAAAAGGQFTDSANGLAALTIGTAFHVSGFAAAGNNGEFRVTASAVGSITVTKADGSAPGLITEAAGAGITIRRGIAGVAATAGTTTGFTAQAPWAAVAQLYRGMPVLIGGNPASPMSAFISDYSVARLAALTDLFGSALSAASEVSIPANVLYAPASVAIPSGSMEVYRDGVVYRFKGCRGNVSFEFPAAGAPRARFEFTGLYDSKADAAVPAVTYDSTRPGTFRNSRMLVNRAPAALQSISLDSGAELQYPPNPNQSEGFDPPTHTRRNMVGSMDPNETLIATRDLMADFRAGTERILHARVLGGLAATAGSRVGLTVPAAFFTGYRPGDRNGIATEELPFHAKGQDSGAFLCFW